MAPGWCDSRFPPFNSKTDVRHFNFDLNYDFNDNFYSQQLRSQLLEFAVISDFWWGLAVPFLTSPCTKRIVYEPRWYVLASLGITEWPIAWAFGELQFKQCK